MTRSARIGSIAGAIVFILGAGIAFGEPTRAGPDIPTGPDITVDAPPPPVERVLPIPTPESMPRGLPSAVAENSGTIKSVDRQDGEVVLESEGKTLQLFFPPHQLGTIDRGDRVTVTVALHQELKRSNLR